MSVALKKYNTDEERFNESPSSEIQQLSTDEELPERELARLEKICEGLEAVTSHQAKKIQELLTEIEQYGATLVAKEKLLYEREGTIGHLENLKREGEARLADREDHLLRAYREIERLRLYEAFILTRLGPTLDAAQHQLTVYQSHVEALQAPGHRAVRWVGKVIGRGWLGRMLRKVMAFIIAIRKA